MQPKKETILNPTPTAAIKTYHEGANDERSAILAKIRREIKKPLPDIRKLEQWLKSRVKRNKAKPGGL